LIPKVSILLPVFDCERTLGAAIESIRRQREQRFECVIVEDGSRDGTAAIARAAAERDPRFRVIARAHAGLVESLNAGLAECRAPIVARMDGDDLMAARRLSATLALLDRQPELAGVGTHVRSFPRAALTPKRLAYERWLNGIQSPTDVLTEAFVECPIAHPTLTMRSAVLQALRYRERGWPEDYDLVLRLLAAGHQLAVVPERLHHWRDTPARHSRTHPAFTIERFVACKAAFLAEGFLRQSADFILWGYGSTGKELCRALAAHGKRPSRIVELHPGRIGQRIAGARVIEPAELARTPRAPLVVSVAGDEARRLIRAELARLAFVEQRDFVVAA
jgi:glycosyltransferase involved in cell wall biosynthesis